MTRMPAAVEMDVAEGAEAEGARRATAAFGPSVTSRATDPDPEVPAKAQRRRFPAEYRLRILTQADACKKPGELGALLRREGLYSSLLTNWRRQREQGALQDMRGRRRGPKPRPVDPRVKQLEAENRRLQRAETIITQVAEILGTEPPRHRRARLMIAIEAVTTTGATAALCQSVGLARATLYRRRQPARSSTPTPRAASSRALGPADARRCSTCCTASGSSISRPPNAGHAADVSLLHAHIAFSTPRRKSGSGAPRRGIRRTRNRSSWRRPRIRSGRGISH